MSLRAPLPALLIPPSWFAQDFMHEWKLMKVTWDLMWSKMVAPRSAKKERPLWKDSAVTLVSLRTSELWPTCVARAVFMCNWKQQSLQFLRVQLRKWLSFPVGYWRGLCLVCGYSPLWQELKYREPSLSSTPAMENLRCTTGIRRQYCSFPDRVDEY